MENFMLQLGTLPLSSYRWPAESGQKIRGVVQIVHGLAEHMGRYDDFATFLNDYGFIVYGQDHPGHGHTGPETGKVSGDAMSHLLGGISAMRQWISAEHPGLPICLFGHSAGASLALRAAQLDPSGWNTLVLSSIMSRSHLLLERLPFMSQRFGKHRGGQVIQDAVYDLVLHSANINLLSGSSRLSWRSRDDREVSSFRQDPLCGQELDPEFLKSLAGGLSVWYRKNELARLDRSMPILIIAGTGDPLGGYGRGAQNLARDLTSQGASEIYLRFYEGARHDLLWETSKQETMYDILDFLRLAGKEPNI